MKNLSLDYLVREPKQIKDKNPLILLLHGYGSNKEDLFSFASELPEDFWVISAQAPIDLPFGGHAWYSINFDENENKFSDPVEGKSSVQKINIFLNEVLEELSIDEDKIFMLGFSQGAILSYAYSMTFPNKAKYVLALSGYYNPDFLINPAESNDTEYFISHGSVDQVIPVEWGKKAPVILDSLGIENSYQEYPVGHGVHPNNFWDLKAWIEERL